MTLARYALVGVLVVACYGSRPRAALGRADGYGQIVKAITWLNDRNVRDATPRDISALLGSEVSYVRRRPVQIFGEWTDDLVWTDVTGRFEIVFGQMRRANAPFSSFRFGGRFSTREAGIEALAGWLALLDPSSVGERIEQLRSSPESYVEYELKKNGERVRVSLGVNDFDDGWSAGVDVENISAFRDATR